MSKDKALIKETGEIHNIINEYGVCHITVSFNYDINDTHTEKIKEITLVHDSEPLEEGQYYILDNNKTYHEKEVVVGTDEIREHKLKNII